MRSCILSFLGGVLFCWFVLHPLVYKLTHPAAAKAYKELVITKIETKRDTIYIPQITQKTVVLSVPIPKLVSTTVLDTLRLDAYAKRRYATHFTRKLYQDTVEVVPQVEVGYRADVTGTLNGMELSFKDYRPQLVIHDSIRTERTILKDKSNGVYLGIGGTSNLRYLGPHVMYQDKQGNAFRIGINALSVPKGGVPELSIGYSRKIW